MDAKLWSIIISRFSLNICLESLVTCNPNLIRHDSEQRTGLFTGIAIWLSDFGAIFGQ